MSTVMKDSRSTSIFDGPYYLSIAGELVSTDAHFDVFNPATGEVFAKAPSGSPEQLEAAIAAAKGAFKTWSVLSYEQRQSYLDAYADALLEHRDELARLLTLEQGKPLKTMAEPEVDQAISWIRQIAARRIPVEIVEENDNHIVELHHTPLGVVGAITPWNFPVLLALWKVAPALITGNTMVIKPSPFTPLTTLRFGQIAQSVLPAGVLSVVSGGNELGPQMTAHPDIAKISFTGSTETGKHVIRSAAGTVKRLTMEMGGNDAAIVMPDADWQAIIPQLYWGAVGNSGQWCVGIKRLYVHSSYRNEFVAAFVEYARQQVMGDGLDPNVTVGPVQNKMQYDKVRSFLDDIKANGYKVVLGGEVDESRPGYFIPVTVLDNPPESSMIVQQEQFGPIVPIIAYDDVDDVVARANDSPFGLGGSVWGRDTQAAVAVANRLETGMVWVNEIHTQGVDIPFGGHKQSGIGTEHGHEGRLLFTNPKTVLIKK
ncbi:aldehyde dehydrogenase family protein [Pseudomonas chengduensis]|jgi:acyl-CoA reductase-like NAD-dependent aldehyde dehydrogenase|uniref:Acyl-CoA reductase n=2 Tax=Pseudomonadaceae TaxID=135621 RepID=A0A1H2LIN6_9PSED|nr:MULTISPECIES: aldehyde dehydrogenase family protein [Pseudomonas]MDH0960997.1 aldehyde dehydrogenase family protein [Pseudomonas chengduensis]MDH1536252.1 aldehyde dehydrogenase family protein [Pseudomonas chengduensis]MDH1869944.1 aldehyde dehydrogenase family protein [Pseudomonas chengduensis]SDD68338.1 Acyl-CoA reductase [Pseudomonas chengduensis]SDU80674.1 Acyl-CoA reductase [Pseudomonas sihuiensis]